MVSLASTSKMIVIPALVFTKISIFSSLHMQTKVKEFYLRRDTNGGELYKGDRTLRAFTVLRVVVEGHVY
jgi:hypothetical protein